MEKDNLQRVEIGCHIEVELIYRFGEVENLEFDLVPDQLADYQAGFLSASAPLGCAILGENVGTLVPYFTEDI
jgi:transcription elongation GreA/GreB family factor